MFVYVFSDAHVSPVVQVCVCCTVNVAFNKEAKISSKTRAGLPGCGAVDGLDGKKATFGTCVYTTRSDYAPWWSLDLGDIYTITDVQFTWPFYKCMTF